MKIDVSKTFKGLDGATINAVKEIALADEKTQEPIVDKASGMPIVVSIPQKDKALTLKQVIVQALNRKDVDPATGKAEDWDENKTWEMYCIQKKVFEANGKGIELDAKEITSIQERVAKFQTPWIYGQVRDMLNV